jgi:aminomethyltransferase
MGYALYGHELSEEIAPNETVSAWAVKMDKPSFLGKNALERFHRHEYGVVLTDKGIAREGYTVFSGEEEIGRVTSGTMSPTLGKAIAIVLVDRELNPGDKVEVQVRNQRVAAEVVKLPFLQKQESKT